jgi:hypothetical protein
MTFWQFIVDIAIAIGSVAALIQIWQKYRPYLGA